MDSILPGFEDAEVGDESVELRVTLMTAQMLGL